MRVINILLGAGDMLCGLQFLVDHLDLSEGVRDNLITNLDVEIGIDVPPDDHEQHPHGDHLVRVVE